MIDFTNIEALTFDCYGTLIDWETGILRCLRSLGIASGSDEEALRAFARFEARAEAPPYRRYREVLAEVAQRLAADVGRALTPEESLALPRSIADWEPFPDTPGSLRRLAGHFSINIISNVDDDLFEKTRAKLGVDLGRVVTAQACRSYKPAPRNFEAMIAALDLPRERIVHVAQSLYHDIRPARELGLKTVWVRRRSTRAGGGATVPAPDAAPDLEVPDLTTLADIVAPAPGGPRPRNAAGRSKTGGTPRD